VIVVYYSIPLVLAINLLNYFKFLLIFSYARELWRTLLIQLLGGLRLTLIKIVVVVILPR